MDKDNKIISLDNDKLNKAIEENKTPADKEEIPRLEDGSIDIEAISTGKDDKGNYIVSDELFDKYYKELPRGTVNESKTYRAYNGGKVKSLTSENRDIQVMGGKALQKVHLSVDWQRNHSSAIHQSGKRRVVARPVGGSMAHCSVAAWRCNQNLSEIKITAMDSR